MSELHFMIEEQLKSTNVREKIEKINSLPIASKERKQAIIKFLRSCDFHICDLMSVGNQLFVGHKINDSKEIVYFRAEDEGRGFMRMLEFLGVGRVVNA